MPISSPTIDHPLVLIGAGKMGSALLAGWLADGLDPKAVVVVDPGPPSDSAMMLEAAGIAAQAAPPADVTASVVVLAIKPQIMGDALPGLRALIGPETTVLSIAAGTTLNNLETGLEAGLPPGAIVRAMPNTPAQVGRGITAAVANARVRPEARALVTELLKAVGDVAWVEDEAQIDAVTAVSGSGPAYVFLFAECLTEAAIEAGLPPDLAARFARATVEGAGELLHRSDLPPATLRTNVTSPGGTTAAALEVLMAEDGLAPLLARAVAAAKKRSEALSS